MQARHTGLVGLQCLVRIFRGPMLTELRRTWGARIRARRGHVSQKQLAERTMLAQATISRIEQGKARVSDETKIRIAEALDCSVGELFGWPEVSADEDGQ